MSDERPSEPAKPGRGRRVFGVIGGVMIAAIVVAALVMGLVPNVSARLACDQNSGTWDGQSGQCDYGPGGLVVRLLEKSKRCGDVPDSSLRECSYAVDRLKIDIIGVGSAIANVGVDGSDDQLGYGVGVFMGEGCVRVAPGAEMKLREPMRRIEDGFVSTWTGEVFASLAVCSAAGIEARAAADATARGR